jgi:hypothetical protein
MCVMKNNIYQTRNITVKRKKMMRKKKEETDVWIVCFMFIIIRLSQNFPMNYFLNKRHKLFLRSFRGAINIGT